MDCSTVRAQNEGILLALGNVKDDDIKIADLFIREPTHNEPSRCKIGIFYMPPGKS